MYKMFVADVDTSLMTSWTSVALRFRLHPARLCAPKIGCTFCAFSHPCTPSWVSHSVLCRSPAQLQFFPVPIACREQNSSRGHSRAVSLPITSLWCCMLVICSLYHCPPGGPKKSANLPQQSHEYLSQFIQAQQEGRGLIRGGML